MISQEPKMDSPGANTAARPAVTAPTIEGILQAWRNQVLTILLRGAVILGVFPAIASSIQVIQRGQWYLALAYCTAYAVVLVVAFRPLPYWPRASFFLLVLLGLSITNMLEAGLRGDTRLFLMVFCIMSLVFFGRRGGWIACTIALLLLVFGGWLITGRYINLINPSSWMNASTWVVFSLVGTALTMVIMLGVDLLESYLRNTLAGERAARQELQQEQQQLERRVEQRTRALQASFQVSQQIASSIGAAASSGQDPESLVVAVANQIQQAFDYYHVQVYLLQADLVDSTTPTGAGDLLLAGGSGEAGRILLTRHHKVPYGRGLVGRAAQTGQPVFVPDTAADPTWLPNPLLPHTRSELAVPIAVGGRAVAAGVSEGADTVDASHRVSPFDGAVLGVLDVQSVAVDGFGEQDIQLIQSIANQLGVALQNARQFETTRRLAGREALVNRIQQRLQTAATVDELLQLTVRELGTALGAGRAAIGLSLRDGEQPNRVRAVERSVNGEQ